MATPAPRRILGMDRELAMWVLVIVAMIILGIVLDFFWGNL